MIDKNKKYWLKKAQWVRFQLNLAFLFSLFLSPLSALAISSSVLYLLSQTRGWELPHYWFYTLGLGLVLALGLIFKHRNFFYSSHDALVHLEIEKKLENQLSAASAGVCPWPKVEGKSKQPIMRWRLGEIILPLSFCLLLIVAVNQVPLRQFVLANEDMQTPYSWKETESWLEILQEEELVDESSLETWQSKLDELKNIPKEDWYKHASMEAGDSLKGQLSESIQNMDMQLKSLEKLLDKLKLSKDLKESEIYEIEKELSELLKKMKSANIKLDPSLLSQLSKMDLSKIKKLSKKEYEQMMKNYKKLSSSCKACSSGNSLKKTRVVAAGVKKTGWGVSRGPGSAPIELSSEESRIPSQEIETVKNENLERATYGDTLGLSQIEHEIDTKTYRKNLKSGSSSHLGIGGEMVWKLKVPPREKKVLERFYK